MNSNNVPKWEFTRWRDIDHPLHPTDPIQPDSPRYVEGEIPAGFVVLLWDGVALLGPRQFKNQEEAIGFLKLNPNVKQYLVIPKP